MINFEWEYGGMEGERNKERKRKKNKREESKGEGQKILHFPLGLSYLDFYFEFT